MCKKYKKENKMTENSVIVLGLDLEEYPDVIDVLNESNDLDNALYERNIEVFGLDDEYWALGIVLSDNDEEYVKEIDLKVLNNYKDKVKPLIEMLKEVDDELFTDLSFEDIKLFHTQRVH